MQFACYPPCRLCRDDTPRTCAATARADAEELWEEDKADLLDRSRAVAFASRPTGRYSTNAARGWDSNGLFGYVEPDPAREAS